MYKYLVEFTVRVGIDFPLDMLRYDSCWPATSDDVSKITHSLEKRGDRPVFDVELRKYCETKANPGVTHARWMSFTCHCSNVRVRKL